MSFRSHILAQASPIAIAACGCPVGEPENRQLDIYAQAAASLHYGKVSPLVVTKAMYGAALKAGVPADTMQVYT